MAASQNNSLQALTFQSRKEAKRIRTDSEGGGEETQGSPNGRAPENPASVARLFYFCPCFFTHNNWPFHASNHVSRRNAKAELLQKSIFDILPDIIEICDSRYSCTWPSFSNFRVDLFLSISTSRSFVAWVIEKCLWPKQ